MPKFNFVSFARARLTFNCKPEGLMLYGQADLERKKKRGAYFQHLELFFVSFGQPCIYITWIKILPQIFFCRKENIYRSFENAFDFVDRDLS